MGGMALAGPAAAARTSRMPFVDMTLKTMLSWDSMTPLGLPCVREWEGRQTAGCEGAHGASLPGLVTHRRPARVNKRAGVPRCLRREHAREARRGCSGRGWILPQCEERRPVVDAGEAARLGRQLALPQGDGRACMVAAGAPSGRWKRSSLDPPHPCHARLQHASPCLPPLSPPAHLRQDDASPPLSPPTHLRQDDGAEVRQARPHRQDLGELRCVVDHHDSCSVRAGGGRARVGGDGAAGHWQG